MTTDHTLRASGLRKRYGDVQALDGFDLSVASGTIHGLLGPNGAGKSTAVKALATLIDYDDGEARVAGFDVRRQAVEVRRRIGLIGQHAAVDEILGGRQNLVMFGRLFGLSTSAARTRADELLATFGLTEAAERAVSTYSGGMRRRRADPHPSRALPRRADLRARPARPHRGVGKRARDRGARHDGAADHAIP